MQPVGVPLHSRRGTSRRSRQLWRERTNTQNEAAREPARRAVGIEARIPIVGKGALTATRTDKRSASEPLPMPHADRVCPRAGVITVQTRWRARRPRSFVGKDSILKQVSMALVAAVLAGGLL